MKRQFKLKNCAMLVGAAMISTAVANSLINFTTIANTDFAMFGFGGMRGIGTGAITVAGVTGTVTRATLIWQGPTKLGQPRGKRGGDVQRNGDHRR